MRLLRLLVPAALLWLAAPSDARAGNTADGAGQAGAVAVLYFDNQGNPDLESLKIGLSQMLITDLQQGGVDVVERSKLQSVMDELDLGHTGKVDPATAAKVGKLVGAQYLVLGSYFEMAGTLRIDARVVDVETGRIVRSDGVNDSTHALFSLEKQLAGEMIPTLVGQVGVAPAQPSPTASASAATSTKPTTSSKASTRSEEAKTAPGGPATSTGTTSSGTTSSGTTAVIVPPDDREVQAALAFSEGLLHLDDKDLPRARESFEKALAADPSLAEAKAELDKIKL